MTDADPSRRGFLDVAMKAGLAACGSGGQSSLTGPSNSGSGTTAAATTLVGTIVGINGESGTFEVTIQSAVATLSLPAFVAFGTGPSFDSLIWVPVSVFLARSTPLIEPFLMSAAVIVPFLICLPVIAPDAAIALPPRATKSAR